MATLVKRISSNPYFDEETRRMLLEKVSHVKRTVYLNSLSHKEIILGVFTSGGDSPGE